MEKQQLFVLFDVLLANLLGVCDLTTRSIQCTHVYVEGPTIINVHPSYFILCLPYGFMLDPSVIGNSTYPFPCVLVCAHASMIHVHIEVMQGALPTKFDAIFIGVFSNAYNIFENGKLVFLQF